MQTHLRMWFFVQSGHFSPPKSIKTKKGLDNLQTLFVITVRCVVAG